MSCYTVLSLSNSSGVKYLLSVCHRNCVLSTVGTINFSGIQLHLAEAFVKTELHFCSPQHTESNCCFLLKDMLISGQELGLHNQQPFLLMADLIYQLNYSCNRLREEKNLCGCLGFPPKLCSQTLSENTLDKC